MDLKSGMSSRLPGFYELPIGERRQIIADFSELDKEELASLAHQGSLSNELVDVFIENAIGSYGMPLGVATNFVINGKDYLIPMTVEESSVLAAASHGAKLVRQGGGFRTSSTDPVMTGQIQVFLNDIHDVDAVLEEHKKALIEYANQGQNRLIARGGGAKDLTWRVIPEINSLIIHLHIDTRDAMGANIVNTMCERVSTFMPDLFPGCDIGLRILTNLNDRRVSRAECTIPHEAFNNRDYDGKEVVERIEQAYLFAYHDIYRATTNNKGVMNGIDPVVIATGNDWRAVEAACHAYTCRDGNYRPMARWTKTQYGDLHGEIELPIAVGTVGGVTKLHPTAQAALKILGQPSATTLAEIMCCVGLAQNLAALRALASEGIQKGHMALHQKNIDLLKRSGATKA